MKPTFPYLKCQQELTSLLRARYPLIFIRSSEESRTINCAIGAYRNLVSDVSIQDGELALWSSIEGFKKLVIEEEKMDWQRLGSPPARDADPILQALDFLGGRLQKQVILCTAATCIFYSRTII